MDNNNVYGRLAKHISFLNMGYPPTEALEEILRENFSPVEAEAALAIPNRVIPLQSEFFANIRKRSDLSGNELKALLDGLAERGLIFSEKTDHGETGYAFPQTFFWKGEDTPQSRKMAGLVAKYSGCTIVKGEACLVIWDSQYERKPYSRDIALQMISDARQVLERIEAALNH